jgi:predicted nucleotidyltransferase
LKRDEILRIAARRGARNLRIFGSVARGTACADSDSDVLVDMGRAGACSTWAGC